MWRFLGEFLSLIFFFLLVRSVVVSLWQSVRGGIMDGMAPRIQGAARSSASGQIQTSGELRKDPVCGTFVLASSAITARSGEGTAYFCSRECRDRFLSQKQWAGNTAARS